MSYIGTPPTDRILTSEDIEAGAVEMSDISWKNQPDNENISGTIDSLTVKLAEKFTLTGDIDISKDLVLTKLADDGEALVLTTDASSRTIEGSGTISSNTFAQVPNASLTSMTGTLGSAVTNNAGVASGTIGSGVDLNSATFPAGHVINTWHFSAAFSSSSTMAATTTFSVIDYGQAGEKMEITGITATSGNLLWMSGYGGSIRHNSDNTNPATIGFKIDGSEYRILNVFDYTTYVSTSSQCGFIYTVPSSFTNKTIQFCVEEANSSYPVTMEVNNTNGSNYIYMIIQEIQQ